MKISPWLWVWWSYGSEGDISCRGISLPRRELGLLEPGGDPSNGLKWGTWLHIFWFPIEKREKRSYALPVGALVPCVVLQLRVGLTTVCVSWGTWLLNQLLSESPFHNGSGEGGSPCMHLLPSVLWIILSMIEITWAWFNTSPSKVTDCCYPQRFCPSKNPVLLRTDTVALCLKRLLNADLTIFR